MAVLIPIPIEAISAKGSKRDGLVRLSGRSLSSF